MRRRSFWWELGGFLWTAAAGTLLHFAYEWSGGSAAVAVFAAVNESVWEHMKLLVMPAFLFTAVQVWVMGEIYPNLPAVRAVTIPLGALTIPVLYYTYTGALGVQAAWVNIFIFFLAAAGMFWLDYRLLRTGHPVSGWGQLLGVVLLWVLVFAFVWCTFRPPELPLWQDPVSGTYGVALT